MTATAAIQTDSTPEGRSNPVQALLYALNPTIVTNPQASTLGQLQERLGPLVTLAILAYIVVGQYVSLPLASVPNETVTALLSLLGGAYIHHHASA